MDLRVSEEAARVFLVHGEEDSKSAKIVKDTLGYDCTIVRGNSEYTFKGYRDLGGRSHD